MDENLGPFLIVLWQLKGTPTLIKVGTNYPLQPIFLLFMNYIQIKISFLLVQTCHGILVFLAIDPKTIVPKTFPIHQLLDS